MNIEVPTDEATLFRSMVEPLLVILVVAGVARTMWGKVDVCSGKLTSPSQVDNDLIKFHRVGGCRGWHRVLNALMGVDHQATAR